MKERRAASGRGLPVERECEERTYVCEKAARRGRLEATNRLEERASGLIYRKKIALVVGRVPSGPSGKNGKLNIALYERVKHDSCRRTHYTRILAARIAASTDRAVPCRRPIRSICSTSEVRCVRRTTTTIHVRTPYVLHAHTVPVRTGADWQTDGRTDAVFDLEFRSGVECAAY